LRPQVHFGFASEVKRRTVERQYANA